MSRMQLAAFALATVLMATVMICSGQDYAEIRGPVWNVASGGTYTLGPKETDNKFYGFYYDIDDDLGTESITLSISSGDLLDGESTPAGVQYITEVQRNRFEFDGWGAYDSIGFLGENHFAGYISETDASRSYLASISDDQNLITSDMLSKVLIDNDDEMTLDTGTPLQLKEGYELRISEIDINGNRVNVDLYKNGDWAFGGVVTPGTGSIADSSFYYKKDSGDTSGLVSIAVHFKNAFRGLDRNLATVDGLFQISENPEHVNIGAQYDKMRISSVTSSKIEMDNKDNTIHLAMNRDIPLMGELRIKTSDQGVVDESEPLRFYLYKMLTKPGVYQINGRVDVVVDGREPFWNSKSFSGFYYDLDRDVGDENLGMKITGDLENGVLNPSDVVYRTKAQKLPFEYEDWGGYYVMGFLGEKCLAGYATSSEDHTSFLQDSSDTSNLLAYGLLSKILIDSDDTVNLSSWSVYPLEEGYELRIKELDVHGDKVVVSLAKDGAAVTDDTVLDLSSNPTFRYKKKLDEMNDVPIIAVNFRALFTSMEIAVAEIDAVWQISENAIKIDQGTKLEKMEISSVDSKEGDMSIEATNKDKTISLGKDQTIRLMGDYYIKTADQEIVDYADPLRFSIFKEVRVAGDGGDAVRSEPGTGEETAEKEPAVVEGSSEDAKPLVPPVKTVEQKEQPGFLAILAGAAIAISWHTMRRL